ncbi:MAG TPA: hypothetical protein VGK48_19155 [Terriglobia bacterium]|jgi:hypothetical protein
MKRYATVISTVILAAGLQMGTASAQRGPRGFDLLADGNASATKQQLQRLLDQYPPSVRRVLQTDPALLANKDYLAPYSALATFVANHPELEHNASFFFGNSTVVAPVLVDRQRDNGNTRQVAEDMTIALVFITIACGITWIVRSMIEYRRWARMMTTQTDIHSSLMNRLTSSEDLLAYIQSPAGKKFLEFAPIATGTATAGPTLNRILWSVQAGLVVGLAGVGLNYASDHIAPEAAQPFFVLGVLGIAVGTGFILSALASYMIARNMGLVQGTSQTPPT